ncbi:MAG: glycoside hydrolase family 27 protein [Gemmatimonadota bacterium]|jgi:alpha-galactosidase
MIKLGVLVSLALPTGLLGFVAGVGGLPAGSPDNGLARTPPMGWNSWNHFGCDVSSRLVRETADAMVESGMKDAGYRYVVIDDCWQVDRTADGRIVADPQRFPEGMKALADYIHDRGLLFGLYTDAGRSTCQGRPGSYGHEKEDARTYAAWGVDYVKVDWCHSEGLDARERYAVFRDALLSSGRDIVFSICEWGTNEPWVWGPETGNLWRTTGDIFDRWESVLSILDRSSQYWASAGPGHWNDPDMLEVGNGGMTDDEYRAHFSLWAVMAAPLMAGNDLRDLMGDGRRARSAREILTNHEVIAVDQDPLGIQGRLVQSYPPELQVWAKPLADGARAVVLLNRASVPTTITADFRRVGLATDSARVRDLWAHEDEGTFQRRYGATVPSHGVVMLKVTPVG